MTPTPTSTSRSTNGPHSTRRVDAHHHVWDLSVRPEPWIDPTTMGAIDRSFGVGDLTAVTEPAGVGATVVVQTVGEPAETEEFLALAAEHPLVEAVTGWVDLTAPDVGDALAALRECTGGTYLRGIRHQVQDEPDVDWLRRADVRAGITAVSEAGCVYELLTVPAQMPAAIATVATLDEAHFVLDHCSKPPIASGQLQPWAEAIRQLAALPNLTCKLSGMVTEADWDRWDAASLRPYVDVVLEAFGPERLMFGSDWPVCLLASSYPRWVTAVEELLSDLSPDEQAAIWSGTAGRIFGI